LAAFYAVVSSIYFGSTIAIQSYLYYSPPTAVTSLGIIQALESGLSCSAVRERAMVRTIAPRILLREQPECVVNSVQIEERGRFGELELCG
jgi:hypothetical protein